MTPDEYCQEKAAASGSSFYYCFLFLPRRAPARHHGALRVLPRGRRRGRRVRRSRRSRATKLAWWRNEVARSSPASRSIRSRRRWSRASQITRSRKRTCRRSSTAWRWTSTRRRYPDFAALERYCHRVAGVVGLLSAQHLRLPQRAHARLRGATSGIAFQLTNIIRDVGEDARKDRIYLPHGRTAALRRDRRRHPQRRDDATISAR